MRFVFACREKGESFASLCRRFGISRKSGYKWLERYRQGGVRALRDASRRPGYCAKAHRVFWRDALRRAREAHPQWGPKKLQALLKRTFPRAKRVPAVSTLALWLRQGNLVAKRKRRARPGPVLPWKGLRVARHCNQVWSVDFKGWFRTGDGRRCEPLTVRDLFSRFILAVALLPNQSDVAVRRAFKQIFRRYGLPKTIRVDNGAPFGRQGSSGAVAFERVVVALGHCGGVHPTGTSSRQRRARTNASCFASRYSRSTGSHAQSTEATHWSLDRLLQCRTSSRSVGSAGAGRFLSVESAPDAPRAQRGKISAKLESAAGAQSRSYQMAGARAFCGTSLCGAIGGTERNRQRASRSLSRLASDRVALRAGSGRNATRFHRATSLKLGACPPPEPNIALRERAPEQTAAPPSSCLLVCSVARSTGSNVKV